MERRYPLRARQRPDQGLRRRILQADPLSRGAPQGRLAARAPPRLLEGGQGDPVRRSGARLRDLTRALRRPDQGRDSGAGARARQDDRPRGLRPGRPDRPRLLRHALLARPTEGLRRGVLGPARGAREDRPRGHRPLRAAHARAAGRPLPGRRRAADLDDALPRRGGRARRPRHAGAGQEGHRQGGQDGRRAGLLTCGRVRPDRVRGHLSRARARGGRGQGAGAPDRRARGQREGREQRPDGAARAERFRRQEDQEAEGQSPQVEGERLMPRPIWSGSLSFGLVNVPVRLMSATRDLGVHFNQLHEKDRSRIEVRRVCVEENEEVPWEEVARGYELESGELIMLTDEELDAADPKKTRTIDIESFVDQEEIDPIFYDHPYYLVPDSNEAAVRAYHLLRKVMERSGQVAIARFVLRTKEYLVAVRTRGDAITLTTMLFHDEVRSAEDVGIDKLPKAKKAEVDQAVTLVKSLQRDFDPNNYEDEHRKRLLAIIDQKRKGQEIEIPDEPETPKAVPDLMAALEASIQRMKSGGRNALAADAAAEQNDAAALKRLPKKDLLARAKEASIEGRSQMSKDELVEALTAS